MIAIINLGKNDSPTGIHEYAVNLNRKEICRFTHTREDGMAMCLRRAAEAVEAATAEKMIKLFRDW